MTNVNSDNLIGVISDTHDQIEHLIIVLDYFNKAQVKTVVHCGDWVSPFTLKHYLTLQAPLCGVFGNNDGDKYRHLIYAERVGLKVLLEDQLLTLNQFGKRIAVYHGDYPQIVAALIKCGDYDVVFHGHDHKPRIERVGHVLSLNPGTLVNCTDVGIKGATFGLYDAGNHTGSIIKVEELNK